MTSINLKTLKDMRVELVAHTAMVATDSGANMMPVSAARVSHGREDKTGDDPDRDLKLMMFLAEHKHLSPFEHQSVTLLIEAPLYVAREWMRHRTQCLAGDNIISFSRPDNGAHYPYELARLYKNWNDPAQRGRLQSMLIRSVDEQTGKVFDNRLVDVTYSGKKDVYAVTTTSGKVVYGSLDHRILTIDGWKTIQDLIDSPTPVLVQDSRAVNEVPQVSVPVKGHGESKWIPGWEGKYSVTSDGAVLSHLTTRNTPLQAPLAKKLTKNAQGYLCVSLSDQSVSRMFNVHELVLLAFRGPRPAGMYCRHMDGNRLNPTLDNLQYGTPKENSEDRQRHGSCFYKGTEYEDIAEISLRGHEDVYDIAVQGPNHNFFANGIVVHNCFNEISMRYTSDPSDTYYIPETFRAQATKNKQSSAGVVEGQDHAERAYVHALRESVASYNELLAAGVARELARGVLPTSMVTRYYATANLRNWGAWYHLRAGEGAQEEIRYYARRVDEILNGLWPEAWEVLKKSNA